MSEPESPFLRCGHEPSNRVEPIREGLCPTCLVALERQDDHGLCPCCRIGWAITPDDVTMVLHVKGFTADTSLGRLSGGSGSASFVRPHIPPSSP